MSDEPRVIPRHRLYAIVFVFPLLGPIVGALLFVALFGTVGILTMGPLAIFAGLMYFFWWLPALYGLFALPFLLTGLLYALAVRLFAPQSLVTALAAAIVAFPAYLGARYWIMGSLDTTGSPLGPHPLTDAGGIAGMILVGVVPCWWLVRDRDSARTRWF